MAKTFTDPKDDKKEQGSSASGQINTSENQETKQSEQKPPDLEKKVPQTRQPLAVFNDLLVKYEGVMHGLLQKKGVSVEEFQNIVINAVRKNPKLLQTDRMSLMASVLTCAELGLRPNTPEQHCFLIPYGKQATFQMGYRGYVHLMYKEPRILRISSEVVCEKDVFEYELGMSPKLKHVPNKTERGNKIGVYAIVEIDKAGHQICYLTAGDVKKLMAFSKQPQNWTDAKDPMNWFWKKSAIKQVSKLVPKEIAEKIAKASMVDSLVEMGGTMTVDEGKVTVIYDKDKAKEYDFVADVFDVEDVEELKE